MTKQPQTLALVLMFALGASAIVRAQEKAPPPKPPAPSVPVPAPSVPVKVTVVISRSQGEKKISSMPYTLAITGDHANLRLGTKIPVMMMSAAPQPPNGPMTHRSVRFSTRTWEPTSIAGSGRRTAGASC